MLGQCGFEKGVSVSPPSGSGMRVRYTSTSVVFTLTVVNEFRGFLSQFLTNFRVILHTLFSIHVVTTLKVSQSFDKYFKS